MSTIQSIIKQTILAYKLYGSNSSRFQAVYRANEAKLNAHKRRVLEAHLDMPVTLTGVIERRGDGEQGNLNLISPAFVNGIMVEHLHVYNEVIEQSDIDYDTGVFIASGCKVYKFGRKAGHLDRAGLGIKPADAPLWTDRNEWV